MFDWLPDSSDIYWAIVCIALAALNIYQYAQKRDLSGTLGILFKHGHAPEGKALVPAESVKAAPSAVPDGPAPFTIEHGQPAIQPAAKRHAWEK